MRVGIVDADLLGRKNHRFPNLACEKISSYWLSLGHYTELITNYDNLEQYDQVYVSKVFTDTEVPEIVFKDKHIHIGGTGFYFDNAPDLDLPIEHQMPDYNLYNNWIEEEVQKAKQLSLNNHIVFNENKYRQQFREYTDYSIGFLTRGCFRKCGFCVNKKYDKVFVHSPLEEFYDEHRKKICLLDDNFLGYPNWEELLDALIETGKPYKFKQGLDERLLTDYKCKRLFSSNYDGDITFAFDNIGDYELIHQKLELIRKNTDAKNIKFYVLVGFDSTDVTDIENAFKRIELLMRYHCLPYIMRYQDKNNAPWKESKYRGMYITLARWCNQPSIFKKMSFRVFCEQNQALHKNPNTLCSSMKAMTEFEKENPDIAKRFFDLRFEDMPW